MNLFLRNLLGWMTLAFASDSGQGEPNVYPTLADGVTATASAAGWTLGTIVEVVPASTITQDGLLKAVVVDTVSLDDDYELVVYTGAAASEVEIARVKFSGADDRIIAIGKRFDANDRISVALACKSTNARTANISVNYVEVT